MAKKSGRRSDADLASAHLDTQIQPTRKLSAAEQKSWDRVVGSWPADHFIASDGELLTQYSAFCVTFEKARKDKDLAAMEKAGRLVLSYATKLRITPQSRYDTQAAGREASRGRANEPASMRLIGGKTLPKNATVN